MSSITIEILRGYRINYDIEKRYPGADQYFLEWTAYREDQYLNAVRWLIDSFNMNKYQPDDAKAIILIIKKFI